ncbi:MAG: hypothetical protein J7527_07390 [Chitinophagaceae bacterium]|nr:hypothetical protein [Chitinophagaceae bacterium]
MKPGHEEARLHLIKTELADIELEWVEIDGKKLKPSQCYKLLTDPVTILFNTNCPDSLRKRIQAIIARYYR